MKKILFFCLLTSFGFDSSNKRVLEYKRIDSGYLKDYNEGYEFWSDSAGCKILYFQKAKDKLLIDEEFVFIRNDQYWRLNSEKYGLRVWNDSVYYYRQKKDHTSAGWRRKFGDGIFLVDPPKGFSNENTEKLYNVTLRYESDSLIPVLSNSDVKKVWRLPDGLLYISQPGLGIVQSESIEQLILRLE